MKAILTVAVLVLGLASSASARTVSYAYEKQMSVTACKVKMAWFAATRGLKLEKWQTNDYYLMKYGERVGNAYYSSGTCYIYLD